MSWRSCIIAMLATSLVLATPLCMVSFEQAPYHFNLRTFSSYQELLHFLERNCKYPKEGCYYLALGTAPIKKESGRYLDFSKTNIQVEGVDEPDIIKTDGKFLYLISGSRVYIIKAYPPNDAKITSSIPLTGESANGLFINGNKLIVFTTRGCKVNIYLYDLTDIENPTLLRSVSVNGSYVDARMIDSHVYLISSDPIWRFYENGQLKIPIIEVDGKAIRIKPNEIYYFSVSEPVDAMTHVISLDINSLKVHHKSFLIGRSHTIYASRNNIYIASSNRYSWSAETTIHKVEIKDGRIYYVASAKVPGYILNQFSMDEHNGFLRVATTTGNVWDGSSKNNIYILDKDMKLVGKIEGLAPKERIYSVRFMGNRAYLVTFKKVDPFFVVDVSDPSNPKVLGELKIPGFSNYLHPYDENHIIGIGKDTVEALPEEKEQRGIDFAWYQGLKIALFDATDPTNPREISKVTIGDRGTYSPALWNHKAFLFSREKHILVIPVTVYKIDDETKERLNGYTGSIYGKFVFQGVYVYNVDLDNGIVYKGRISHGKGKEIKRSLYIGNVLYTFSDEMIKMNRLDTLEAIGEIEIP
ncbi:MAG: hypothetical protein DRN00_05200 [Thermoplasmata archaeon]|nr:MAG: hypothetical protein DRN00_05200 [Thermoplasmata archaeon]